MVASCAEKTCAETTIGDVVAAARVSRTTFYREFDDKRACFDAALAHCVEEARAAAAAACSADQAPAEAVREAAAALLELLAARPELAQMLVGEAVAVEPAAVDRCRDLVVPALARLWDGERDGGDGGADGERPDPRLAFGRAQVLVFERVAAGEAERLPELLPELVYLALAPFAGHDAALAEAEACSGVGAGAL